MSDTILCVEDDDDLRGDLCEELVQAGYQVLSAANTQAAIVLLMERTPDLILCDVMLGQPERDGFFLLRYLRNQSTELACVPFIFLTAIGHKSAIVEARVEGVDDYLVKPIDYDLLLATVKGRLQQVARVRSHSAIPPSEVVHYQSLFSSLPGAVLLCEGTDCLIYANNAAERLRKRTDLWSVRRDQVLSWPGLTVAAAQQLRQGLAQAGDQQGYFTLERGAGQGSLLVTLMSLQSQRGPNGGPVIAVFLSTAQCRPLPQEEVLRSMYGLTPTEAKVALALADGRNAREISERFGITSTTVAFHLRNIYSKAGVARQSDVVALVLAAGWSVTGTSVAGV